MDTLFHFVFAFIAGMAVNAKLDHEALWVAIMAFSAVLIDVDHLLFTYSRTFHSLVFVAGAPVILFYAAYRHEKGSDSIKYQSLAILLFVMLVGHSAADLFSEGAIKLLYPFSTADFAVPSWSVVDFVREDWLLSSRDGVALAVYGTVIGISYYAEEFIYFFEKRHESASNALKDALGT